MKLSHLILCVILLAASLAAQNVQSETENANLPQGSIEGSVINEVTHEPVRKAQVIVVPDVPPAITDASGRFAFRNLKPGTYYLQARHPDFPVVTNGLAPSQLLTVNLSQDEQKRDVVIALIPGGSVSGRIVDEDRKPIAGCAAQVLQFVAGDAGNRLYPVNTAYSDNRGEYRISGLSKGHYYVSVQCNGTLPVAHGFVRRGSDADIPKQRYATEFYPDTPDLPSAARVMVAAGTDLREIDFHLHATAAVSVRGRLTGAEFEPGHNATINLVPRDPSLNNLVRYTASEIDPQAGTFRIEAVPAGAYSLVASAEIAGRVYHAQLPVDIGEAPPKPLELPLIPAASINGSIEIEGDQPRPPGENLRIRLTPVESGVYGQWQANVEKDGTFSIGNVLPGRWCLRVESLPGYVKSLSFGGEVVHSCVFGVAPGAGGVMRVVVSTKTAQVEGTVEGTQPGADSNNISVIMIREDPDVPAGAAPVTRVHQGRFTISGLEPGHYRLYALTFAEAGMLRQNPRVLKALQARGTQVAVEAGGRATVQVQILPTEQLAQVFDEVE